MRPTAALRGRLVTFVTAMGLVAVCGGTAAAGQIGFVYALQQVDGGTNQIHGFRFDQTTGVLTPLPGFRSRAAGRGRRG